MVTPLGNIIVSGCGSSQIFPDTLRPWLTSSTPLTRILATPLMYILNYILYIFCPQSHSPSQRPVYHQEIKECKALIVYVQNLSHAPSDTPPSPNPLRPKVDQSSLPAGEFLPRKGEEEGGAVLIPAVTRKKSKRDKRRHTVSAKVSNILVIQSFKVMFNTGCW